MPLIHFIEPPLYRGDLKDPRVHSVLVMFIAPNAALIRALLDNMPVEGEFGVENFPGDLDEVLFGLREMLLLGLIAGEFGYGEIRDPVGPLLISASAMHLTKRGRSLK